MQADGLLRNDDNGIRVLAPGRLLIRNICMVFDRHLRDESHRERFSKAI
jgi:oxygen-independent coproporphyrinogen-3 oxidase